MLPLVVCAPGWPVTGRPASCRVSSRCHLLGRYVHGGAANINFWLTFPKPSSGASAFDNIAIASTTYKDMVTRTWRTAADEIAQLQATYGDHLAGLGGPLAALFFAFNTRFLLNPSGDPN